jgi:CHAT domain-containing protein
LQKAETPSRLWWCPTGPFAFLPIHAAGIYDAEECESVADYVVSSYTLTLSTLLTPPPFTANPFKMMVVIQPQTPGYPPLPHCFDELCKVEQCVPSHCLVRLGIPTEPASVDRVFFHLSDASLVHFACHGKQDERSPLESALMLEDGWLKVSRIMSQPMPNASFAFLSVCQAAMGDETLPDEAIHLAAALLFAGFHGAVATMW